ncbi:hypothetical protein [endosymbiont GvMRE of Glomus versiforme]|uniref:hypothetical protein n=1 Tax=endosymbiont GvMRE of Glomus versiforme TaxID=2039283 RepID=UPI000EEEC40D|nr:hypothetical protein [endosymbiont GvMRE of Glomus versiforme]RHZ35265.1 hypothetical protein GvMRE_IIg461 [endosymbiont GvMRE of Glomus versiforme]
MSDEKKEVYKMLKKTFCCDYLSWVIKEKEVYLGYDKKSNFFYIPNFFSDNSAFRINFCPWCGKLLKDNINNSLKERYKMALKVKESPLKKQIWSEKISEELRREILRKHYDSTKRLVFSDSLTLAYSFKFEVYWTIIEEMNCNFTIEEVAKKIQISEGEMKDLLSYEIDKFSLEKLIIYANRLVPNLWLELTKK